MLRRKEMCVVSELVTVEDLERVQEVGHSQVCT